MPITIGQRPDHTFSEPLGLLSDCHRRIETFLHILIAIVREVDGGALTDADAAQLQSALNYFAEAAPVHTADEERSLFPRLRQCADPEMDRTLERVALLEMDHRQAAPHHAAIDRLVRQWIEADGLHAEDANALRGHLMVLRGLYEAHIATEDREVFPAAARLLSTRAIDEIGREMKARRLVRALSRAAGRSS
jgi:hemerythrin-like domain-containing protein